MREFYATLVVICCDFSPSVTTRLNAADRKELLLKLEFMQRIARGSTRRLGSDVCRFTKHLRTVFKDTGCDLALTGNTIVTHTYRSHSTGSGPHGGARH